MHSQHGLKKLVVHRDICKFKIDTSTLRKFLLEKGLLFGLMVKIPQTSLFLYQRLALPPNQNPRHFPKPNPNPNPAVLNLFWINAHQPHPVTSRGPLLSTPSPSIVPSPAPNPRAIPN